MLPRDISTPFSHAHLFVRTPASKLLFLKKQAFSNIFTRPGLYLSARKYEIAGRLVFGLNMKIALEKYSKEVEQIIFLIYSQRNLQQMKC